MLYITGALIMIRSIFRMIEYALGWDSVLLKSELYLFLLDAHVKDDGCYDEETEDNHLDSEAA